MFYWACFVCVCVCACVRVSLIDTTLTNWDTIHIVYFQLPWKSREIWPCSPGKQQSGWRTAICLDTVTRLSSPRSPTPPIPFIFPTRRPLGSSFITVRGMLFVLLLKDILDYLSVFWILECYPSGELAKLYISINFSGALQSE